MNSMTNFLEVKTLEEARMELEKHWRPYRIAVDLQICEAGGRVLAEEVFSRIDLPPFDRSAVDGYAVIADDTFKAEEDSPVQLKCKGSIRAGEWPKMKISKGECAEIATGAPLPRGANAVVMVEHGIRNGNEVRIYRAVAPKENITPRAYEFKKGDKVASAGQVLTPPLIGTLAAVGAGRVKVFKPPAVSVISSGEEIVEPGEKLGKGKVYDVNSPSICEAIKNCGGMPKYLGIARDDAKEVRGLLKKGVRISEIVIISGGTSAGRGDIAPKVADALGRPGLIVHGLAIRPGKPTFIAVIQNRPIFGLPGYPVSALMIFDQLVAPYLRYLSGLPQKQRVVNAILSTKILSTRGRRELIPVKLTRKEDNIFAEPLLKGSGAITALSMADGYIDIPLEREIVDEGEKVLVNLFRGGEFA